MLALLLTLASGPALADVMPPPEPGPAELGVLKDRGCLSCHSTNGRPLAGPSLAGLWGQLRPVIRDGQRVEELFQEDALRSALLTPSAEVREGFPNNMPAYTLTDEEIDDIKDVVYALGFVEVESTEPPSPWPLGLAVFAFVFGHLGLSAIPVRRRLIAALEDKGFQGLYAMLMLAAFMGILVGWVTGPHTPLWDAPRWTTHIPISVMPIVWVLWTLGYTAKSPTAAGMDKLLDEDRELATGILRVTRHPANLGNGLWALVHLAANPELRNVLLFGGMLTLSVLGSWHIDRRRAAEHPEGWARYAKETSFIPFLAILQGRNRLVLSELGWKKVAVGLLLFVGFLAIHPWVIGVSPLPRMGP
ncbi:MAG: hypothetical protein H6740_16415 [Alphaproteobacteria bacterium]|nr:hypothetical protein [Alphaproteobacteria bacterium]